MVPQENFGGVGGKESGKGPAFKHKEINQRGSRMCKDPFPRYFNGLLGKEAGERDLLPDVGTYPRGT